MVSGWTADVTQSYLGSLQNTRLPGPSQEPHTKIQKVDLGPCTVGKFHPEPRFDFVTSWVVLLVLLVKAFVLQNNFN